MLKNKTAAVIALIAVILAMVAVTAISTRNSMTAELEKVKSEAANIDTMLKRRADLIPNLVGTVKGYMTQETAVIDSLNTAADKLLGAATLAEKADAANGLDEAVRQFSAVLADYPELTSSAVFIQLQDELAGTENRIAVARRDYNAAARRYNEMISVMPQKLFASLFGFERAPYFELRTETSEAPDVSF